MIKHTVILRLNRPTDPATTEGVIAQLREFGAEPPFAEGPATILVDLGLRPEGRSVSEVGMEVHFADAEAFASYLAAEKHVALVNDVLLPNCESWLSVQNEV